MAMPFTFDMAILIGRFQPFHRGHAALLGKALASAPQVTVVLGSALGARNTKNPCKRSGPPIAPVFVPGKRLATLAFSPKRYEIAPFGCAPPITGE